MDTRVAVALISAISGIVIAFLPILKRKKDEVWLVQPRYVLAAGLALVFLASAVLVVPWVMGKASREDVEAEIRKQLPPGTIIAWYAKDGAIPEGWFVCDGANGTPNLQNRFMIGATAQSEVGNEVGALETTVLLPEYALRRAKNDALRTEGDPHGIITHESPDDRLVTMYSDPKTSELRVPLPPPPSVKILFIMKRR